MLCVNSSYCVNLTIFSKKTCLMLAKEKPSKTKGKPLEDQEQVLAEINIENIPVTEINFVSNPAPVKSGSPSKSTNQPYHVRKRVVTINN